MMTEPSPEKKPEQEQLTTEIVQERFLEKLAELKVSSMRHDSLYNNEFEYTAPDGFGHIIRITDGRAVVSTTYGPNEPIKHTPEYPFVMTSLHATIRSAVDVDLALHGSHRRYRGLRAAYYDGEEGASLLDLIDTETVEDNDSFPPETWE
jgi:hypothetical protein